MSKNPARVAAETIAATLRERGFAALLAGGCVRDLLLGLSPKDYDVATDATPDDVAGMFRRTEKVGAKFGVVIVRMKGVQVEVATFRSDFDYRDGRRPESVQFGSAEEDALRRDFTINGMFLDPVDGRIIDLVGGQEDLRARVVRAIGDPERRFAEDHLRMLRAVRFAARLRFEIDPDTMSAIRHHAVSIRGISAERIQQELALILGSPNREHGCELLRETGLVEYVLPGTSWTPDGLDEVIRRLAPLPPDADFMTALAAVLVRFGAEQAAQICRDLRCSTVLERGVAWLIEKLPSALISESLELADIKLMMADRRFARLAQLAQAEAVGVTGRPEDYERLARRVAGIPADKVAPPPLVTGDDLQVMNLPPGPIYGRVLEAVYRAQLNETLTTREEALRVARVLLEE